MLKNDKEKEAIEKRFYKTLIAIPSTTTFLCVLLIIWDICFNSIDPSEETFIKTDYLLKFIFLLICSVPINLGLILIACFGFIIFGLTHWPFSDEKSNINRVGLI